MQRNQQAIAICHLGTEPLNLVRIDIGSAHLHRGRQIDNHRVFRGRLPHGVNRITHLNGKVQLRTSKALWRVLEHPLGFRVPGSTAFDQLSALYRNVNYALTIQPEHLLALHRGCGIVDMHYGPARTFEGCKGFFYQVRPRLGQHLYGNVLRNSVIFDQVTHEIIVVPGCGGETHLDLLETNFNQLVPQA